MAIGPASSIRLSDEGARLLDAFLAAEIARVQAGISRLVLDSPLVSIAFLFVNAEDVPIFDASYAWTESSRNVAFAEGDGVGIARLWSPPSWDIEQFPDPPDGALYHRAAALVEQVPDSKRQFTRPIVLRELAWRLSRADWGDIAVTSPDFAAWAHEYDSGDAESDSFRLTAPTHAVRAYEERGWI